MHEFDSLAPIALRVIILLFALMLIFDGIARLRRTRRGR